MAVQKTGVKKSNLRLILIIVIAVIAAAGIIYIATSIISIHVKDKYEEVLSGYFKYKSDGNLQGLSSLESVKFRDELSVIDLKGANYSLYSYNVTEDSTLAGDTNSSIPVKKITFSLIVNDKGGAVSYLCEAFLHDEGNSIKIDLIKLLYRGKNITKLSRDKLFKA